MSRTLLLCAAIVLAPGCATQVTKQPGGGAGGGDAAVATASAKPSGNRYSELAGSLREQWGVEVDGIRPSAAGYMLDFRYRVLDAEKARPLLDRRIKPELVVAKSGAVLKVPVPPKIGALRQSAKHIKEDRSYFILFSNPGKHVLSGDKVSVVIGDFKAENLMVQ